VTRKGKGQYDNHHLLCRSRGGGDEPSNIARVPRHLHQAWHALFKNWSVEKIVEIMNQHWIDPSFTIVAVPRIGDPHV